LVNATSGDCRRKSWTKRAIGSKILNRRVEVGDAASIFREVGNPFLSVEWAPAEQKAGHAMRSNRLPSFGTAVVGWVSSSVILLGGLPIL
jgi:hypothetical protein